MTRAALMLVPAVVVVLAAVACGSSESAEGAREPTRSTPPSAVTPPESLTGTPITDSAVLQSAMLTTTDLPTGYTAIPDPVRDLGLDPAPEYDSPDRSGTDPRACASVLAPVSEQWADASADAVVRYSGPSFSSIDEDAAGYPDDGASRAFEALQRTFVDCAEYTGTDADGVAVEYRLSGRDQEPVGAASTSVRLETTSDGVTLVSEAVVAVVDHTVVQLVATSQDGVDPQSLTALARAAVDRITGLAR